MDGYHHNDNVLQYDLQIYGFKSINPIFEDSTHIDRLGHQKSIMFGIGPNAAGGLLHCICVVSRLRCMRLLSYHSSGHNDYRRGGIVKWKPRL